MRLVVLAVLVAATILASEPVPRFRGGLDVLLDVSVLDRDLG